eukprot:gene11193-2031_t
MLRSALITSFVTASVVYAAEGPCDIYDAAPEKTPCVAAHSTVRALYGAYSGPLYMVRRMSDNTTQDISPIAAGGYADSAAQDAFCGSSPCVIWQIYDQTTRKNRVPLPDRSLLTHLSIAPPGGAHREEDRPCNATKDKLTVGGHPVYSAYFEGGMGYRIDDTNGIAVHDEAETMYMVTSGMLLRLYGNAETNNLDDGAGTMEAVYFGNAKGGLNHGGAGKGPWIMADMENALWGADVVVSNEEPINHTFVTAMVKGDVSTPSGPVTPGPYQTGTDYPGFDIAPCHADGCVMPASATHTDCEAKCNATSGCVGYVFAEATCSGKGAPLCWLKGGMSGGHPASCRDSRVMVPRGSVPGHWAIKGGDAQQGGLKVYWDGKRAPGYAPMKKQGAIILGIGGDNSDGAIGTFYEGVMTAGYASDMTDDKIQANIVAAGYGK